MKTGKKSEILKRVDAKRVLYKLSTKLTAIEIRI